MADVFEGIFSKLLLLMLCMFVFCFLFLVSLRAILRAYKNMQQTLEVSKHAFADTSLPTPTPTQLGMLLSLFHVTPTPSHVESKQPAIFSSSLQPIDPTNDSIWEQLANCESGQHWNDNTGNGFYGGLQFTLGTWAGVGGVGKPSDASKEEQIYRAKILESRRGFNPWPVCSRKLGLR